MYRRVLQTLVFVLFFGFGAVALAGSVLCEDLIGYFRDQGSLQDSRRSTERLRALNKEYDALLKQLEEDPQMIRRITAPTLGKEPNDPCTVYPRVKARELKVAREAVLDEAGRDQPKAEIPVWLLRCAEPRRRLSLFVAGASLVIISLVCFTPEKKRTPPARDPDSVAV